MPADTAQVALDLARELMELALGGGESLLGGAADPTVLTAGAGAPEGLGAGISAPVSVWCGRATGTGRMPTASR